MGSLWKHTDFNNKTTVFEYDSNDRLTNKTPDASFQAPPIQFSYTAIGQRETMSDASGLTKYEYLDNGRLWKKAAPNGTLTYTYDENGNVKSVHSSTQNGLSLNYEWDELNRLSKVIDNGTGGTTQYKYDGYGRLQEMDYPASSGVKHIYGYDEVDRLTSVTVNSGGSTLGSFAYVLGPTGNRTQLTENLNGAQRTVNYGYDNLYRLTNETIAGAAPTGSITYDSQVGYSDSSGFDPVGNRRSRASSVSAVSPASYSYDGRDRLNSDSYDNNGNTTYSGNYYYGYDFENRLIWRNAGGGPRVAQPTFDLGYDADGNRVAKTNGTTITLYLVDEQNPTGYPQVVEESQSVNAGAFSLTKVYTYGIKLISQTTIGASVQYHGFDGHGDVRLLLNTDATVAHTYSYDAFGIPIAPTSPPAGNDYLYAGEQFDRDLGFYYLRARYYRVDTGRFLTMDTYPGNQNDPLSLHKYLYVADNPLSRVDRSGHDGDVVFYGPGDASEIDASGMFKPAGRLVARIVTFKYSPLAKKLLNHYMDESGTPYTLSEQEMTAVRVRIDLHHAPEFDKITSQLSTQTGTLNVDGTRVLLFAGSAGTLGRFFGTLKGQVHGTSPKDWNFSGTINFSDTYDFDPQPFNFPNTSSFDPNARAPTVEMEVRAANHFIPGKPFDVKSVSTALSQTSEEDEATWAGKGMQAVLSPPAD